jgi:hypothetical protein
MSLQASSMGLLHQQPALAQQHNNEIQSFFSRLLAFKVAAAAVTDMPL